MRETNLPESMPFHGLSLSSREDLAPHKHGPYKRKNTHRRVAMNTKGRKTSENIEDKRSYFGTDAYDPDYPEEDRNADFLKETLHKTSFLPQQFKKAKK